MKIVWIGERILGLEAVRIMNEGLAAFSIISPIIHFLVLFHNEKFNY
jgi:hypothetical protein